MKHLDELNFLIDSAKAITGSDAETARTLGVARENVAGWRSGARTCTPEDQALLAAVAGLDPAQTLIRATVEKWEGKPKGDLLMRALGKLLPRTGAVTGFVGAGALAIYSTTASWATQCVSGAIALMSKARRLDRARWRDSKNP